MARSKSRQPELQFVWPRDRRPNGSKKRTFLQGLSDILTNRGPDIFITRKHDKTRIPLEIWGNWDGYHSPQEHAMDRRFSARHPFWNADRGGKGGGAKRYDPHSRKYVDWELDQNWEQHPMRLLPYYTRKEHEWRARHPGRRLEGKDYAHGVPKRHNAEYQPFWHRARRIADNQMAGYMEETDNIGADQYNMAFTDRVRGTPGMGRCHTVGVASRGRPDFYLGGPGQRRKLAPIWAQYDARTDNRARWGVPDESWEEEDDNMEMAYVDGMRRDRDRWGPSDQRYIW